MEINEGTYGKIRHILPVQRSLVTVQNITFIKKSEDQLCDYFK